PCRTREQVDAQLLLKPGDIAADPCLRRTNLFSSGSKATDLGDSDKRAQGVQVEGTCKAHGLIVSRTTTVCSTDAYFSNRCRESAYRLKAIRFPWDRT